MRKIDKISIIFGLFVFSACFSFKQQLEIHGHHLPMPTMDEVALINDKPLTLASFLFAKSTLRNSTLEKAFWLGASAILLQQRARSEGKLMTFESAIDVGRYALGEINSAGEVLKVQEKIKFLALSSGSYPSSQPINPIHVKGAIDLLIEKSTIIKNQRLMSMAY